VRDGQRDRQERFPASGAPRAFPPRIPANRAWDVIGLGANAADHLVSIPHHPHPGEKVRFTSYRAQGGGQAATALVTVSRLGYRARYFGAVGDDADGEANLAGLREEGVDVSGVIVRPGALTQRAFILVDGASGERTIVWGRSEGLIPAPEEIDPAAIAAGRLFHTDAQEPRTATHAARAARAAGMPVLADLEHTRPGIEELLPLVDFLIVDERFPERLTGARDLERAAALLEERAAGALVVVTLGARGALARIDGGTRVFPAYAIDAVDTTGAGDVFHGAFAVACLDGMDLAGALDFANAVAAMKCLAAGGRTGIPRERAAIAAFQRETPHRRQPHPGGCRERRQPPRA